MNYERQFRKDMGFTNQKSYTDYLNAKDIVVINWDLIKERNKRIVEVFEKIQQKINVNLDIAKVVNDTTEIAKNNGIVYKMNNNGRNREDVFFKWMQGYLTELIFTDYIAAKLDLKNVERFGGDDINDIENFRRVGDADLVDHTAKVYIEVQLKLGNSSVDIKKHKVMKACEHKDYDSYVAFVDIFDGKFAAIELKPLKNATFTEHKQFEGQLTYKASKDLFQPFG